MRTIHLYCHRDDHTFVQGLNAANPAAALVIEQNDTLQLVVHNLERNRSVPALTAFIERPLDFTSIRASIGTVDKAPTKGTFKLRVAGETTTALSWPSDLSTAALITAWKLTVITALKVLSTVGSSGVESLDTATTPAHFFNFRWTDVAKTDAIEVVENKLSPHTEATVLPFSSADGGLTHIVKLTQFPAKIATSFARPESPAVTITETRPGDTGTNAEQTINIPALANGSFSLQWDGATTKTMAVGTATAASITAALNAIVADGTTSPQFRCEERAATVDGKRFAVEFIGALASASQDMLVAAMHDQASLPWAVGTLDLAGNVQIEQALAGATSVDLTFELVISDASGEETFLRTVTIQNDITGPGTIAAAEEAGAVVTRVVEVNVDAGLGTPFAQASPGHSTALPTAAATNVFNITHNLGTWKVKVTGWYKISITPEEWVQIPDDQFEARSTSENVTSITLPFDVDVTTPTAATYATRYSFTFGSSDSEILLYEHSHRWLDILETVPSGQTLAAKLAAIDAAISGLGGGAVLQGGNLADGTVSPAKLDITALSTSLFANAKFVELLRAFGADETFIRNFLARLNTSTTLADVRIALFTALLTEAKTSVELQTLLLDVLKVTEGFQTFLYAQLVSALAGGSLPPGYSFTCPDVDLYLPPPTSYTLGTATFYEYRGLPICYQTGATTTGATLSGTLPATGTVAEVLTTDGTTFAPECDARPQQTFPTGAKLIWNGNFYQRVTQIGNAWYPWEMEATVIDAFLSDANFPASSIATLNAALQHSIESPADNRIHGRWRLALELGVPTAESGELNLNAFQWSSAGTHTLNLGPEQAITGVQLTITRPSSGVFGVDLKVNGRAVVTTVPSVAVGPLAVRARLTQFDIQNNTTPRGAVRCKVVRPGGIVVAS